MHKIALTGGIGTGKTYLSRYFIRMGIPVFYADDEAKKLYQDALFRQRLAERFGDDILVGGAVDLARLSRLVFSDEARLQALNELVHPVVMQHFEQWAEAQSSPTVMMESAIVYEGGLERYFDTIIVADATLELRLNRIQQRNPELTREEIMQRMARQLPQEEKCRRADLVVRTGETYSEELSLFPLDFASHCGEEEDVEVADEQ